MAQSVKPLCINNLNIWLLCGGGGSGPQRRGEAPLPHVRFRHQLPLSRQRHQQRGSGCNSGHSQPCPLHRFLDGRLVRTHPCIFRIMARGGVEHRKALWSFARLSQCHLENFSEMQRVAIRLLRDLLAATETIGDDEPVRWSAADGWKTLEFAARLRNLVFIFFEAESSSHAAASGSGSSEVYAQALQHSFFRRHLHDG